MNHGALQAQSQYRAMLSNTNKAKIFLSLKFTVGYIITGPPTQCRGPD